MLQKNNINVVFSARLALVFSKKRNFLQTKKLSTLFGLPKRRKNFSVLLLSNAGKNLGFVILNSTERIQLKPCDTGICKCKNGVFVYSRNGMTFAQFSRS